MAQAKTLNDLFIETLKDIYYAEQQIVKTLPKMAKVAASSTLAASFEEHREQSEVQIERLEQIFEMLDLTPRGKTCDAILGINQEGKEIMADFAGTSALDAGLIAAAQAVEHYEIARYGTLKTWARQLGYDQAVSLLDATLREEMETDEKLTALALEEANVKAT